MTRALAARLPRPSGHKYPKTRRHPSDAGIGTLTSAFDEGALPGLQQLWLHENEIGADGVAALLKVGAKGGALRELTFLSLDKNRIEKPCISSIIAALSAGALPKLKNCMLEDNPAGPRAPKQVAEALQKRAKA